MDYGSALGHIFSCLTVPRGFVRSDDSYYHPMLGLYGLFMVKLDIDHQVDPETTETTGYISMDTQRRAPTMLCVQYPRPGLLGEKGELSFVTSPAYFSSTLPDPPFDIWKLRSLPRETEHKSEHRVSLKDLATRERRKYLTEIRKLQETPPRHETTAMGSFHRYCKQEFSKQPTLDIVAFVRIFNQHKTEILRFFRKAYRLCSEGQNGDLLKDYHESLDNLIKTLQTGNSAHSEILKEFKLILGLKWPKEEAEPSNANESTKGKGIMKGRSSAPKPHFSGFPEYIKYQYDHPGRKNLFGHCAETMCFRHCYSIVRHTGKHISDTTTHHISQHDGPFHMFESIALYLPSLREHLGLAPGHQYFTNPPNNHYFRPEVFKGVSAEPNAEGRYKLHILSDPCDNCKHLMEAHRHPMDTMVKPVKDCYPDKTMHWDDKSLEHLDEYVS